MSMIADLAENKNKFEIINSVLKESYNYSIDYNGNLTEIISLCDKIMEQSNSNPLFSVYDNNYSKANLIKEAVQMFLREVAPARRRRKHKRRNSNVKKN